MTAVLLPTAAEKEKIREKNEIAINQYPLAMSNDYLKSQKKRKNSCRKWTLNKQTKRIEMQLGNPFFNHWYTLNSSVPRTKKLFVCVALTITEATVNCFSRSTSQTIVTSQTEKIEPESRKLNNKIVFFLYVLHSHFIIFRERKQSM